MRAGVERDDSHAAVGIATDIAFRLQQLERLADRSDAQIEPLGDLGLLQP